MADIEKAVAGVGGAVVAAGGLPAVVGTIAVVGGSIAIWEAGKWIYRKISNSDDEENSKIYDRAFHDGYVHGRAEASAEYEVKLQRKAEELSKKARVCAEISDENVQLKRELREWLEAYEGLKQSYDECQKKLSEKTRDSYSMIERLSRAA